MKVTINIDCTPEEARRFLGLPDFTPLQDQMVAAMSEKMQQQMDQFEGSKMLETWLQSGQKNADFIQQMMQMSMSGFSSASSKSEPKE